MKVHVVWTGRKASFLYPFSAEPRTAVLVRNFRGGGNVRIFPQGWCKEAAAFQPCTIVGSKAQLAALADSRQVSVTHALIAILRPGEKLVTEGERERLWRAFGVPVFSQIVDGSGRLLASECEAHDGLHLTSPEIDLEIFQLEGGRLDGTPCGCGKKTSRLRTAGRPELERLAAYAR